MIGQQYSERQHAAHAAGIRAAVLGRRIGDNPYRPRDADLRRAWRIGFNEYRRECALPETDPPRVARELIDERVRQLRRMQGVT